MWLAQDFLFISRTVSVKFGKIQQSQNVKDEVVDLFFLPSLVFRHISWALSYRTPTKNIPNYKKWCHI